MPNPTPAVRKLKYLSPVQIADALGVSKMTAYRLIHSGELPAARFRRSLRVLESDFLKYVADNSPRRES